MCPSREARFSSKSGGLELRPCDHSAPQCGCGQFARNPTAQILSQVKTKGRFWVTHPNSPWKTNPRVVGISPRSTFLCILNCAVLHSTLVRSFHIHFHLQAYQLFIVRIVHDVAYYVSSLWEVLWQDRFVALLGQVPMVYCTDRPFMI